MIASVKQAVSLTARAVLVAVAALGTAGQALKTHRGNPVLAAPVEVAAVGPVVGFDGDMSVVFAKVEARPKTADVGTRR